MPVDSLLPPPASPRSWALFLRPPVRCWFLKSRLFMARCARGCFLPQTLLPSSSACRVSSVAETQALVFSPILTALQVASMVSKPDSPCVWQVRQEEQYN